MKKFKNIIAGISGNILEHYDNALYALLVPFIVPLFFPHASYLSGLILGYGIQVVGLLMRPLGALVFGYLGDLRGRKHTLFLTICGMSLSTLLLGALPTYSAIEEAAPILLLVLRGLQNFFAGGEIKGGALFILEHGEGKRRPFLSGLYDSSTILGIFLASAAVALLAHFDLASSHWRYLFLFGGACGALGLLFRFYCEEPSEFSSEKTQTQPLLSVLFKNKKTILFIALTSGFSYVTYAIPLTLMNGFLPLISSMTKTQAVEMNTYLLVLDMLLLPVFGWLCRYIPYQKMMLFAATSSCLLAIPLFLWLGSGHFMALVLVRVAIVLLGAVFAAPLHQWALDLLPVRQRYLISAFGSSLGTQIFGAPCSAICLWLFQMTGWIAAPGFYLAAVSIFAIFAVLLTKPSFARSSNKEAILE